MSSLTIAFCAGVTLLAATACDGHCRGLSGGASGALGTVTYTTQDGKTLKDVDPDFWGASNSTLELRGRLGERAVQITFTQLVDGATRSLTHDDAAKACLPIQGGAAPTCLLLDGTIEVTRLRHDDCDGNENITFCSEDVDVTIHAKSTDLGLSLSIDVHVVSEQHWQHETCGPD